MASRIPGREGSPDWLEKLGMSEYAQRFAELISRSFPT